MQQELSQSEIIDRIKSAVKDLNKNFPEKITQNAIENNVSFKFEDYEGEDGKKTCMLHFIIRNVWEKKYDIAETIAEVVINKASEYKLTVTRDPDVTAAGEYNRSFL